MIAKGQEGNRLLEIDNVHIADCGQPPFVDATDQYVGYFENQYGEQWVFTGNPQSGEAVIRGGDAGWGTEYIVSAENPCPNTILNEPEKRWVVTCFMAMSGASFEEVVANYNKGAEVLVADALKKLRGRSR